MLRACRPQANERHLRFRSHGQERAEAEKAPLAEGPRFIAFASLSMPPEALKALVRDMGRAGGVTVLRGFPAGDAARFKQTLAAIWQGEDAPAALGIDPGCFAPFTSMRRRALS
jgi:conjugal transfer pilus assembly protein TrbC